MSEVESVESVENLRQRHPVDNRTGPAEKDEGTGKENPEKGKVENTGTKHQEPDGSGKQDEYKGNNIDVFA